MQTRHTMGVMTWTFIPVTGKVYKSQHVALDLKGLRKLMDSSLKEF